MARTCQLCPAEADHYATRGDLCPAHRAVADELGRAAVDFTAPPSRPEGVNAVPPGLIAAMAAPSIERRSPVLMREAQPASTQGDQRRPAGWGVGDRVSVHDVHAAHGTALTRPVSSVLRGQPPRGGTEMRRP